MGSCENMIEEVYCVETDFEENDEEVQQMSEVASMANKKKEVGRLVRLHTCLWDKKDSAFRNQVKRQAAWSTVAYQMNVSG